MSVYSIRNILVPVDFSDTSMNAIETAVALVKRHKAVLHLFYVAERNLVESETGTGLYSSSVNADVLSAIASAIRHKHELQPNVIEVEGNVTECIAKAAAQLPADLIVMGTHGASGVREGFVGTNTYNTLKHANCPVLTVPPGRKITVFKKVLFPIRPVSGALRAFAAVDCFIAANATIDVFGVSNRSDVKNSLLVKLVDEVRAQGRWANTSTRTFLGSLLHAHEAVLQHAASACPDLVVLTATLDPVAKTNYIGPHAQKIIHSVNVPVLTIKKASVPSVASVAQ